VLCGRAKRCIDVGSDWWSRRSSTRREEFMKLKVLLFATSLFVAVDVAASQAQAFRGNVSSAEEGQMEGVLVSAKREGSTITTTVVSNDKVQFASPPGTIEQGRYTITIRAAGYNLVGPKSVDVDADSTADIKLARTRHPAAELSNAEWIISVPGADSLK